MMRRVFLLIAVLIGLLPAAIPTYACSDGPGFFDQFSGAFIYAEVLQTDLYGQNAVLSVREVLSGEAPETVLLVRNEPGQTIAIAENNLGNGDCNFILMPLQVGKLIYLGIHALDYGGYSDNGFIYNFDTPDSTVFTYRDDQVVLSTEPEFRDRVAEITGGIPHAPTPSGYPRFAPLHITFEDGSEHLLPVDSDILITLDTLQARQEAEYGFWARGFPAFAEDSIGCLPPDCEVSPDGVYLVRNQPGVLEFRLGDPIESEVHAFAPVGGLLASAYKDDITIYRLGYARNGNDNWRSEVARYVTRDQTSDPHPHFQWSADGRKLAFTDGLGLWVWEVYTADAPVLIRPRPESGLLPFPRQFSPLGNYLEVIEGDSVFWQESRSDGAQLPWGYWSPDEVSLLAQTQDDIEICPAISFPDCESVLIRQMNTGGDVSMFLRLRGAAWHSPYRLTYWACDIGDEECAAVRVNLAGYWSQDTVYSEPRVRQFVYQSEVNHLALVYKGGLFIDGQPIHVDGRITAIRWLRPLWATR